MMPWYYTKLWEKGKYIYTGISFFQASSAESQEQTKLFIQNSYRRVKDGREKYSLYVLLLHWINGALVVL